MSIFLVQPTGLRFALLHRSWPSDFCYSHAPSNAQTPPLEVPRRTQYWNAEGRNGQSLAVHDECM